MGIMLLPGEFVLRSERLSLLNCAKYLELYAHCRSYKKLLSIFLQLI